PVFDSRKGRGGDACLIRDITQAETLLLSATSNGVTQFGSVDTRFSHGAQHSTDRVLAATLCFIAATQFISRCPALITKRREQSRLRKLKIRFYLGLDGPSSQ